MHFAMSYSFGKDSAFALYKMIKAGHKPVCLITAINKDNEKSWTHGINPNIVEQSAKALGLPILQASCSSENYETVFEEALQKSTNPAAERTGYGCSLKVLDSGFIPLLRPRGAGYETLATNQKAWEQRLAHSATWISIYISNGIKKDV